METLRALVSLIDVEVRVTPQLGSLDTHSVEALRKYDLATVPFGWLSQVEFTWFVISSPGRTSSSTITSKDSLKVADSFK